VRSSEEEITEVFKGILPRLHTLVIGPGCALALPSSARPSVLELTPSFARSLGRDKHMQLAARVAIKLARENDLYLVLDADALFLVQSDPSVVKGYKRAVLTPNVVEFQRLAEACVSRPSSLRSLRR